MRTQILSPSGARPVNLAINGAMDLWQRIAGNSLALATATPTVWSADRFSHHTAGPTTKSSTVIRSTNVPAASLVGTPPPYSLQVTCNTTVATPAAADRYFAFRTVTEDKDMVEPTQLGYITYAFEFFSTIAGNYPCRVYNFGTNRSYVTTFAYTTPSVWQQIVVQIPLESTVGHLGFYINHDGSTFQTAVGSWVAGDFSTPTGGGFVNLYTSGLVMRMTNFSVFAGRVYPQRTNFYRRTESFAQELALAQRYFEKTYEIETAVGSITNNGMLTTTASFQGDLSLSWKFKVDKRAAPTAVIYNPVTGTINQLRNLTGGLNLPAQILTGGSSGIVFREVDGSGEAANSWIGQAHATADAEI